MNIKAVLHKYFYPVLVQIDAGKKRKAAKLPLHESGKIRVGFIVQMPQIWDKEAPIYEKMREDKAFEAFLIVVPRYDFVEQRIMDYGEEYEYFKEKYGEESLIRAKDPDWKDLRELELDYVFYQRCFEHYLPDAYHTDQVIEYARTCYTPYGYYTNKEPRLYYETHFFRNLCHYFCSCEEELQIQKKRMGCVFLGYPSLENPETCREKKEREPQILWTPRWTDDDETGGSGFLKYMWKILELRKQFPDTRLVLRPHPLTFQNCVSEKLLTAEEVEDYKNAITKAGAELDRNARIEDSFRETDILITDLTSALIVYILTGRPLIYCSKTTVEFSATFRGIIDCAYHAETWDEIQRYVEDLKHGIDPLKENRTAFAEKILRKNQNSSERFLEYMKKECGWKPPER